MDPAAKMQGLVRWSSELLLTYRKQRSFVNTWRGVLTCDFVVFPLYCNSCTIGVFWASALSVDSFGHTRRPGRRPTRASRNLQTSSTSNHQPVGLTVSGRWGRCAKDRFCKVSSMQRKEIGRHSLIRIVAGRLTFHHSFRHHIWE